MIKVFAVLLPSILVLSCGNFVHAASAIPPGSFIRDEAESVGQLVKQVQNDPLVSKRYTTHFAVSPKYLVDYLQNDVELVTLREPLKTRVWYVGKDGKIFAKTKLLPRGTQVFASKEGKPVILWRCGNPLIASLPQLTVKTVTKVAGANEVASAGGEGDTTTLSEADGVASDLPETKVLANPVETIAIEAITVPPGFVEQIIPAVAGTTPIATIPAVEAIAIPAVAAAPPIGGGGTSFGWLGGLAGLAGVAALVGGGGGNLSPALVPEPSTLLAMGFGLISISMAVMRRRRQ